MHVPGVAFGDRKMDLAASSPRSDSAPGTALIALPFGAWGLLGLNASLSADSLRVAMSSNQPGLVLPATPISCQPQDPFLGTCWMPAS
jgi:hypothetical protein